MKTHPRICSFGSNILLKHLTALQQEAPGVRAAEDIEHIHRMRVASRRLRAALPLFADCFGRKRVETWSAHIRNLTIALGASRDTDVQIEAIVEVDASLSDARLHAGLRRLILRLRQQRQELQAGVTAALDELEGDNFYADMQSALLMAQLPVELGAPQPHELYTRAASAISARLDDFLAYEIYIQRPECVAELHAMRIAAKKLRYTIETFASLYPAGLEPYLGAVKANQELLGNIHDCDVWLNLLPEFSKAEKARSLLYFGHANAYNPLIPGLVFFENNRRQEREAQYQEFLRGWENWTALTIWNELRRVIASPLQGIVFPPAPAFTPSMPNTD
jgi:CHAD domain-containing protein